MSGTIPPLELSPMESGIGLLVRRGGTPVAYFLEALPSGSRMSSRELGALVYRRTGVDLTRAAIRDELHEPLPAAPLDLTVAVCTRDRPELLRSCLTSLMELPEDVVRLVVDNAPTSSATRELVAAFPGVHYVREPRAGLDIARNRALAEAGTTYLAFVDDDVVVDHAWLSGLAEAWTENPDAGAVTGLVLAYELETEAQVLFERRGGFRRGTLPRRYAIGDGHRSIHPYGPGAFGTGANMAFRTAVLRELGGFDPALDTGSPLPGGGDLDAFFRVLAAGHVLVYAPGAAVWHRHRRELAQLRHQYWTWGSGYLAFLHRTYRQVPSSRAGVARAAAWWLRRQTTVTWRSLRGRDPVPVTLAAATLAGGLVTAAWKYPWSAFQHGRAMRR